jgi:hypothetical protein
MSEIKGNGSKGGGHPNLQHQGLKFCAKTASLPPTRGIYAYLPAFIANYCVGAEAMGHDGLGADERLCSVSGRLNG